MSPRRRAPLSRRLAAALALAASSVLAGCSPAAKDARPERPGIVLVIGDDVGFGDYGFMGSEIARTPSLDALAEEGVVFTHGFTPASVCVPSLQALLTGLEPYAIETGLTRRGFGGRGFRSVVGSFALLPALLAERGYATFQGGKFWEGDPFAAGFTHAMTDWPPWRERPLPYLLQVSGGYSLALGRETLDPLFEFLDAHGDGPFFVWYAPMLPHVPFDAPPRFEQPYRDLPLPADAKGYYANLTRLDASVGEIRAYLEHRGLRERTALVYVADNGWDASKPPRDLGSSALGGEAGKLSIHEQGFRTPVVLSWPGVLPEGRRDDRLVALVDVFATILDLAGVEPPPGTRGQSLLPLLAGGGSAREHVVGGGVALRDDGFAPEERPGPRQHAWYLRTPEWRYVFAGRDGRESLYRIEEDPGEANDLAASNPEVLARLRKALLAEIDAMDRAGGPAPR